VNHLPILEVVIFLGMYITVPIKKLYIDQQAAHYPVVQSVRSRMGAVAEIVADKQTVFDAISNARDPMKMGKEILFMTRNKGAFVKKCPGTSVYNCCGYQILHIGSFCHMDCSYCILQAYFHPPMLQYFVNYEDLYAELQDLFAQKKIFRIGTGEFTDSMIWELWTDLSKTLVPIFGVQRHAVLELKTKTTAIDSLKKLPHNRKTIVSWSLNTERIIAEEERGTATLKARLNAAARCQSWGYPLAFHFDPILIYQDCETEYRRVVQLLFEKVAADNIAWISMGTFRFMPSLKQIIQQRFPRSKIVYGEFITGLDGKMRYFKPLRIQIYQKIIGWIREMAPDVLIYFCMEDDEVWQKSLGFIPTAQCDLPRMLDVSAIKLCNLNPESLNE